MRLSLTQDPGNRSLVTNARELSGTLARLLWLADDASAVIAKLEAGEVVKGAVDPIGLAIGVPYRFLGHWVRHPKYGEQFAFDTYVPDVPHARDGIIKYLAKVAPGIGKHKAAALWEAFGSRAVEVVRTDPERVVQTGILRFDQAQQAAQALAAVAQLEKTKIDLFGLLSGRGFPGTLLQACIRRWGARAPEIIRHNPYKLLVEGLAGCGFTRCDRLYLDLGGNPARLKRQMLSLWHRLQSDSKGDTWFLARHVAQAVTDAVGISQARPVQAARLGKRARWLATRRDDTDQLWLAETAKARNERRISERVGDLLAHKPCLWPQGQISDLSEHQQKTVQRILTSQVAILSGIPGTGKTSTAAAIVRAVVVKHGRSAVAVCAPTGKAAVRCTSALLRYGVDIEATTIHRLLEVVRGGHDGRDWSFRHNATNPLPYQFIIIDESSMLDTDLAAALLAACAAGTHVLFVGDPYQLPPVGHGAPLRDLIAAGVPCGELSEIHRNAGQIVHACAAIKNDRSFEVADRFEPETGKNLRQIATVSAEQSIATLQSVLSRFGNSGRFDPVWDCQVLVAVNEKSKLSRKELNRFLQAELNPAGRQVAPNPFRIGDKIICLRNNSLSQVELRAGAPADQAESYAKIRYRPGFPAAEFVANGDIGRVLAVSPKLTVARFWTPDRTVAIPMGKPKEAAEGDNGGNGCDFTLAYACTCHKLQGSESPVVIILIDGSPAARMVCSREWYYTALSRAKILCILIGQRSVMERHCRRVSLWQRKTFLKELLGEVIEP